MFGFRSLVLGGAAAVLAASAASAASIPLSGHELTYSDGFTMNFCAKPVDGEFNAVFGNGQKGKWTHSGNVVTWWDPATKKPINKLTFTQVAGVWHGKNQSNGVEFTVTSIGPATQC